MVCIGAWLVWAGACELVLPLPAVVMEAEKTFTQTGRYLENDDNKPIFEIKKR